MPAIITKLPSLKKFRIFRNYCWPNDLDEFKRFNLIYGWNGSGKSTLASLFKALQNKKALPGCDVQFTCGKTTHKACEFGPDKDLPNVRVFDADFVRNTVSAASQVDAIYFLGEVSVEKQQQIERLNRIDNTLADRSKTTGTAASQADELIVDFCAEQGRLIKAELRSGDSTNQYNNYTQVQFKAKTKELIMLPSLTLAGKTLTVAEREELKTKNNTKRKQKVLPPAVNLPDVSATELAVKELLQRTVLSTTIESLAADPIMQAWAQQGFSLHVSADGNLPRCNFCDQPLTPDRIRALEGHFNDQYEQLQRDADSIAKSIDEARAYLRAIQLPHKGELGDHRIAGFDDASELFTGEVNKLNNLFDTLSKALTLKKSAPFKPLFLDEMLTDIDKPDMAVTAAALEGICHAIEMHNNDHDNFDAIVRAARIALEEALVCDSLEAYQTKLNEAKVLRAKADKVKQAHTLVLGKISQLKTEIEEHRQPAEELNKELACYLGRDELRFEVEGIGYRITRNGEPAEHLSEGEKTGIAFLYFLKALQDKGFSLTDSVVVIDDPVSSLDANALFSAFGYMCDRTKDAGQLFILTHNFTFFRQVKSWFTHKKKDRTNSCLYMLESCCDEEGRFARICKLDTLLTDYETDYHYLFKLVYDMAHSDGSGNLSSYYAMPNIARRLLESFLSFRYPLASTTVQGKGGLEKMLGNANSIDDSLKRMIIRFVHTCSHFDRIGDPEHDPTILSETPKILKAILKLMKEEDQGHYGQMLGVIEREPDITVAASQFS